MSNINDFVIENGVLKEYTGNDTDIIIPDSVTSIGKSAFSWCDNLKSITIPDSVTSIGDEAFAYCSGLEGIIIPDSVTSIGEGALNGCELLKDEEGFVIIRDILFDYYGNKKTITIPSYVIRISSSAFYNCVGLENITIPDSVTSIGNSAFASCHGLESITIPDSVTSIGNSAFASCRGLESITIPDSVTSIGNGAFSNCIKLNSITIPDSVTRIGEGALNGCELLKDEEGFVIIRDILFDYYGSKKSIKIPSYVIRISHRAFYNCDGLKRITIPNSVTSIGDSAFWNCFNLKNIAIPDSVTSIGNSAFWCCSNLQSITIPNSVTSIGDEAFAYCSGLESITMPDSVTSIGNGAFEYCHNIKSITIPDSVTSIGNSAFAYCHGLESITIPDSVISIGNSAFSSCYNLKNITIPDSVTSIGDGIFRGCYNLESVKLPTKIEIGKDFFDSYFPKSLYNRLDDWYVQFSDGAIKQYLLNVDVWKKLKVLTQAKIFLSTQTKALKAVYSKLITKGSAEKIAKALLEMLPEEASAKECNKVAFCMDILVNKATDESIRKMYDWLCSQKKGKKAVATISENLKFTGVLSVEVKVDEKLPEAEKIVLDKLLELKTSKDELAAEFKKYYSLTTKDIPQVKYKTGGKVAEIVLMWLFMLHEEYTEYWILPSYKKPGICKEAQELISYLDEESFQGCLLQLADRFLGISGNSKKMYLAYPICRYADDKLMTELTKRAPKWRSSVSGDDAPPLLTFRNAVIYSEFRSAMMFADKYDGLKYYAEVRDTTEDTIRDKYLSDVGVDSDGCKEYDLGNQKVVAKLQSDLSFIVMLENGKTAKSLPKKGADEKLYEVAKADFDAMKKDSKKIVKNRKDKLFEDFLSVRERKADEWQKSYIDNPLLRMVASLLVWAQGNKTFTLKDGTPVTADGSQYCISSDKIKVAHPMEMKREDVTAWQQYFVSNGIKQPFEQIWEPVIDGDQVKPDRYKDARIPYYRFTGKSKHGIFVEDYDFHNEINITLKDCEATVNRLDWQRHMIDVTDCFEIEFLKFKEYTRQINHLVAYFDKCTIYERIAKDDVAVEVLLKQFTLAQITEFIRVASENNATNVQALLLEYKNNNFSNFDPMEEFTLD